MFDLSSPVLAKFPLPADILRDYTLEFEIRVERVLMDLRECLREANRVETSSRVDGLALELVQAKAYIYSTLSMEYR